jgi:hypothetical protein
VGLEFERNPWVLVVFIIVTVETWAKARQLAVRWFYRRHDEPKT